jgi:ubiquinone/menaquinone biosynthesis C-methylase UbiE
MSNRLQAEFTRQANQMNSAAAFKAEFVLEWFVKAVCSLAASRVLDLACGPGIVAEGVSPFVKEIVGIDATPEMIRLARDRFEKARLTNGRFDVGSAASLPFRDAEFDQVITRLSFHHFPGLKSVLGETRRVLRPHGRLVFADIISSENAEEAALHNALEQLRDPTHVCMLTREGLLHALRSAGFELVTAESWEQERSFSEWAQIISDPARTGPLREVMRALARKGQGAGIDLREHSGELYFVHRWLLVVAQVKQETAR